MFEIGLNLTWPWTIMDRCFRELHHTQSYYQSQHPPSAVSKGQQVLIHVYKFENKMAIEHCNILQCSTIYFFDLWTAYWHSPSKWSFHAKATSPKLTIAGVGCGCQKFKPFHLWVLQADRGLVPLLLHPLWKGNVLWHNLVISNAHRFQVELQLHQSCRIIRHKILQNP